MRTRHVVLLGLIGTGALACSAKQAPPAAAPESTEAPTGYAQQPGSTEPSSPTPAEPEGRLTKDDESSFASIDEAEAALAQAQAALNPELRADPAHKSSRPDAAAKPQTKTPSPAGSKPQDGSDRCLNACKAFASLKRAAAAVCRLAGEADARCKRAQSIVSENEARMTACKCAPNGE